MPYPQVCLKMGHEVLAPRRDKEDGLSPPLPLQLSFELIG